MKKYPISLLVFVALLFYNIGIAVESVGKPYYVHPPGELVSWTLPAFVLLFMVVPFWLGWAASSEHGDK